MLTEVNKTPICEIGRYDGNLLYIKRDDLIPYSFGGNKARKAILFFNEIDADHYDTVVTYGSGSSNHCRIVANMAEERHMKCIVVSPEETEKETYNTKMIRMFGAEIVYCPVSEVHDTIERTMATLRDEGRKPYFIPGGGHGNLGTQAYVNCYDEIADYSLRCDVHFDYIFHASGTGTTQAGLVAGQLIHGDSTQVVGISIARKNPRGRQVVVDSVKEYLIDQATSGQIEDAVCFVDDHVSTGYGQHNESIDNTIRQMMVEKGIPMDSTYTGKAYCGMLQYIQEHDIKGKHILFIHTGGTPLYFDWLNEIDRSN